MDIEQLCIEGVQEWVMTSACKDFSNYVIEEQKKQQNEDKLRELLQQFRPFIDKFPKQKQAQLLWKRKGEAWLKQWIKTNEMFMMSFMTQEHYEHFFQITKQFLSDARAFDDTLSVEDIGQAMRNIWIIILLQQLFNKPIRYHKAMFAYSMLYPYSDNYLDDIHVPYQKKKQFNAWFRRCLLGEDVDIQNEHEEKILALIYMIEDTFARDKFPEVYESLLTIHDAQVLSLLQQDGKTKQSETELTYLSYRKGGSSVVADGFLIDGTLCEEQIRFCMRYGFILQIDDDLQDICEDRLHHHQTLASCHLSISLDNLFKQLLQYTIDILQIKDGCLNHKVLQFLLHDSLFLLFFSVIETKEYYDNSTIDMVRDCLPVNEEFLAEMIPLRQVVVSDGELWKRLEFLFIE